MLLMIIRISTILIVAFSLIYLFTERYKDNHFINPYFGYSECCIDSEQMDREPTDKQIQQVVKRTAEHFGCNTSDLIYMTTESGVSSSSGIVCLRAGCLSDKRYNHMFLQYDHDIESGRPCKAILSIMIARVKWQTLKSVSDVIYHDVLGDDGTIEFGSDELYKVKYERYLNSSRKYLKKRDKEQNKKAKRIASKSDYHF